MVELHREAPLLESCAELSATIMGKKPVHEPRRKERSIPREDALSLLERAEYGVLSTIGADHQPYGIPLSFCLVGNDLYFHCALEGHKLVNLEHHPKVSFCVVGETRVLPGKFATEYESAVLFGTATEVFDAEKQAGLEGLLQKYSSDHFENGLKYIKALDGKTKVFRVSIDAVSGKARR